MFSGRLLSGILLSISAVSGNTARIAFEYSLKLPSFLLFLYKCED